jgi:hypothetical protein
MVLAAVSLCVLGYKVKKCCLPVLKPFLEVKQKTKQEILEMLKSQMDEYWNKVSDQFQVRTNQVGDTKLVIESIEMDAYYNQPGLYPHMSPYLPRGMVKTGGGVTPVRASAPVEAVEVGTTLGNQPGVDSATV